MRSVESRWHRMMLVTITQQRGCPGRARPPRVNVQVLHSGHGYVALKNGWGISLQQECSVNGSLSGFHVSASGSPGGPDGKESACNVGDPSSILGSGRCAGGGHGNPLQYSRLENPMDRGAWGAAVHRVANSQTQLNDEHFHSQECSACVSSLSPFTERERAWVCLPQFTWESGLTLATRLVNTEGLSASFVFRFHT